MKNFKRMCSVLLVAALLIGCFSMAASAATIKPGLTVNSKGVVMLGNNVYYGYGINLYSTFQYHVSCYTLYGDPLYDMPRNYKEDFAMCKKYNIQYARIPFSSWGIDAYELFDKERDVFFQLMDDIVAEAEKQQIGIVASLLWNLDALPYYVGEKRSEMGNPNSKTVKFAKEYAAAIVQRYKDSPAIWGWEIGNEYNLVADLCSQNYTAHLPNDVFKIGEWNAYDYYTSVDMQIFYKEVATVIRKYDKYRMISNGNGEMRSAAYNMNQQAQLLDEGELWTNSGKGDTYEEFVKIIKYHTPDPMDTLSFHYQAVDYSTNPPKPATMMQAGGTKYTLREAFTKYVQASRASGRACYFGEFGDFIESESYNGNPQIETLFRSLLDDMIAADIQLATGWFPWGGTTVDDWGVYRERAMHNEEGLATYNNQYKVEQIKLTNEQFAKAGKQDVEAYWSALKGTVKTKVPTKPTATTTTKSTTRTEQPTVYTTVGTETTGTTDTTAVSTTTTTEAGDGTTDTTAENGSTTQSTADTGSPTDEDTDTTPKGSLSWLWWMVGAVAALAVAGVVTWMLIKKKA